MTDPDWLKPIVEAEKAATEGPWEVAENPGHNWIMARSCRVGTARQENLPGTGRCGCRRG